MYDIDLLRSDTSISKQALNSIFVSKFRLKIPADMVGIFSVLYCFLSRKVI